MQTKIKITGNTIQVIDENNNEISLNSHRLPQGFIDWQLMVKRDRVSNEKKSFHGAQESATAPGHAASHKESIAASMGAHIATFITYNSESPLKITSSSKGVLLLPQKDLLPDIIKRQTDVIAMQYGDPMPNMENVRPNKEKWDAAEPVRQEFLEYLYKDGNIDWGMLGVLEIFEGQTIKNIIKNPECCFHFLGMLGPMGRGFQAYQINCIAEIIKEGPELTYMRNMKIMSDFYGGHIPQKRYSTGYLCHVIEVYDKNPFPHVAGKRLV
jgi:hypothetical protein